MKRFEETLHEKQVVLRLNAAWRPELGSILDIRHKRALNCPQRSKRCLLRLGHAPDPRDIEPLVRSVSPQCT